MPRQALRFVLAALACAYAGLSHADLWGYVDEKGVAHFSATRVDTRYELYFKGPVAEPNKGAEASDPKAVGVPLAHRRLLAFFDISTNYKAVRHLMREASDANKLDYELLKAVIATESGFDPKAISSRGAVGLMQLTAVTAQRFGFQSEPRHTAAERLAMPEANIRIGAKYLAHLLKRYQGNVELALAAYNSGEGTVERAGNRVPDIVETRQFVQTVMQIHRILKPPVAARPQVARARSSVPTQTAPAETFWY